MSLKAALPLILFSSIATAEEYRSFSEADFSRFENGSIEIDEVALGSTWYFDRKVALGPLKEFEYVNKTSNIFGSYSELNAKFPGGESDSDVATIGGEYFANNVLVGGSYRNFDNFDVFTATLGYLFNENFLVSLDSTKIEGEDANYVVSARYNHQLGGSNYIGFNISADDDFDASVMSSRYFTQLAGENYLAAELSYTYADEAEDFWSLGADYYFNEQTSVGLGVAKHESYSLDFTRFFTRNIALGLAYTTGGLSPDGDTYELALTLQF